MNSKIVFVLSLAHIALTQVSYQFIFITSQLSCNTNSCNGTIQNPYDNLFTAINKTSMTSSTTIYSFVFLGDSTVTHYFIPNEQLPSGGSYYNYTQLSSLNLSSAVDFRPFYCDDPLLASYDQSHCINRSSNPQITIVLKNMTIGFIIASSANFTMSNLLFDGNDLSYNQLDGNLSCLLMRFRCCTASNSSSCSWPGLNNVLPGSTNTNSTNSTFLLFPGYKSYATISNTIFQNIVNYNPFVSLMEFVFLNATYANVTIVNSQFNNNLFTNGTIFGNCSKNDGWNINISNSSFVGYYLTENASQTLQNNSGYAILLNSITNSTLITPLTISSTNFTNYTVVANFSATSVMVTMCNFQGINFNQAGPNLQQILSKAQLISIRLYLNLSFSNIYDGVAWLSYNIGNNGQSTSYVVNCNFIRGVVQGEQIFLGTGSFVVFANLTFSGQTGNSSRLFLVHNSNFNLSNTTFQNINVSNTTLVWGQYLVSFITVIQNITFTNVNVTSGFLVGLNQSTYGISIQNCQFSNSFNATYHLYISQSGSQISISNSTFTGASAIYFDNFPFLQIYNISMSGMMIPASQIANGIFTFPYSVTIIDVAQLNITNSQFINLTSPNGAMSLYNPNRAGAFWQISNCTFQNNIAAIAGALSIDIEQIDTTVLIQNSTFLNNSASSDISSSIQGEGGAIYYHCKNGLLCYVNISTTQFLQNSAAVAGGAIYWDNCPPFIDLNTVMFISNQAPYGNQLATNTFQLWYGTLPTINFNWQQLLSPPGRVLQNASSSNEFYGLADFVSGQPWSSSLIIYEIDIYGQVVSSDNQNRLSVTLKNPQRNQSLVNGNNIITPFINVSSTGITAVQGVYNISNVLISFWPSSNLTISFTQFTQTFPSLPPALLNLITVSPLANLSFQAHFRDCILGEIFSSDGTCQPCNPGTYKINLNNNSVESCPTCEENAYCYGGGELGPKPGYWRLNATSDLINPCPNQAACLGNNENNSNYSATGACYQNYSGNLCNSCPNGYANDNNVCIDCRGNAWYYSKFALQLLLLTFLIAFQINSTLDSIKSTKKETQTEAEFALLKKNKIILAELVKILTNFLQMLSLLTLFNFNWPTDVDQFQTTTSRVGGNPNQFSFDCFFINDLGAVGTDVTYYKFLTIFLIPFGYLILAVVFWIAWFKYTKFPIMGNPAFISKLIISTFVIAFSFQPTIIQYALLVFECINLYRSDIEVYFLTSNYDIQCFTGHHFTFASALAAPSLFLWAILFPAVMLYALSKYRNKLDDPQVQSWYAFIYQGYKDFKFYWDFVIFFRKLALVATLVFLASVNSGLQGLQAILVNVVLHISLNLQLLNKPFEDKIANLLEDRSLTCITIISAAGLYFDMVTNRSDLDNVVIAIAIAAGSIFILSWLFYFLKIEYETQMMNPSVSQAVEKIKTKCDCCRRKSNKEKMRTENREEDTKINNPQQETQHAKEVKEQVEEAKEQEKDEAQEQEEEVREQINEDQKSVPEIIIPKSKGEEELTPSGYLTSTKVKKDEFQDFNEEELVDLHVNNYDRS